MVNIHKVINIHANPVQRESFKEGKTEGSDIEFLPGYISFLSGVIRDEKTNILQLNANDKRF